MDDKVKNLPWAAKALIILAICAIGIFPIIMLEKESTETSKESVAIQKQLLQDNDYDINPILDIVGGIIDKHEVNGQTHALTRKQKLTTGQLLQVDMLLSEQKSENIISDYKIFRDTRETVIVITLPEDTLENFEERLKKEFSIIEHIEHKTYLNKYNDRLRRYEIQTTESKLVLRMIYKLILQTYS